MAKLTLLQMTQNILSALDSDSVNSINDTVEALQVAEVVKEAYFELIANDDWPEQRRLVRLTELSDLNHPNYMMIPLTANRIGNIKYNCRDATSTKDDWRDIEYLPPEAFLDICFQRDLSESTVDAIADFGDNVVIPIVNDKAPTFWTTFDDKYLCFDSYDSGVDDTLQDHKATALATLEPTFTLSDTFIPEMDSNLFPLLLNEAKGKCFSYLKQEVNSKVEASTKRQRTKIQNQRSRTGDTRSVVDYSR